MLAKTTNQTLSAEERQMLVGLLECGDFRGAREYADRIISSGVPNTLVNSLGYDFFRRYSFSNPEFIRRMTDEFRSYRWECWWMS